MLITKMVAEYEIDKLKKYKIYKLKKYEIDKLKKHDKRFFFGCIVGMQDLSSPTRDQTHVPCG